MIELGALRPISSHLNVTEKLLMDRNQNFDYRRYIPASIMYLPYS